MEERIREREERIRKRKQNGRREKGGMGRRGKWLEDETDEPK